MPRHRFDGERSELSPADHFSKKIWHAKVRRIFQTVSALRRTAPSPPEGRLDFTVRFVHWMSVVATEHFGNAVETNRPRCFNEHDIAAPHEVLHRIGGRFRF